MFLLKVRLGGRNALRLVRFSHTRKVETADVCVIGSGPIGSLYARRMVEDGRNTILVEAGGQHSALPGDHQKNVSIYQRELNTFSNIIQGTLQRASIPPTDPFILTDNPGCWQLDIKDIENGRHFIKNGQNPHQNQNLNLPGFGIAYGVGGMATHWTACIPRQHPDLERYYSHKSRSSGVYTEKEWDRLYTMNEEILNRNQKLAYIDGLPTLRHTLVQETMASLWDSKLEEGRRVQSLPLAAKRLNKHFIRWSAPYNFLEPIIGNKKFTLVANTLATKLEVSGGKVKRAHVKNLITREKYTIEADNFVVACNTVLTPQLLWKSEIRPPALGKYLCEQPMTFCQIVLRQDLVDKYLIDPRFAAEVQEYKKKHSEDPLTIPMDAPDPQVYIPVTKDRPWHAQIHRDAFSYGLVLESIDTRLIVDLRYFYMTQPNEDRHITFSDKIRDIMGMPQPTFQFYYTKEEKMKQYEMMEEMTTSANALGGYLAGSEPKFMPPGLALHATGTVRIGTDPKTSVCDEYSKVHGYDNLYVGGNGVIPTQTACNPTLTSLCFAQKACESIIGK